MRLSEAIRLGAMLKPQAFARFFDGHGTCVFGAAADAVGELDETRGVISGIARHPDWNIYGPCPEGCCTITVSPMHLNAIHRRSR